MAGIDRFSLPLLSVSPGDLVVCHGILGFPGQKMGARVLSDSSMPYPAREGMAWVRETGLGVDPVDAFVIECAIEKMS